MLLEMNNAVLYRLPHTIGRVKDEEPALVRRFATFINAQGSLLQASPALKARVLEQVKILAKRLDMSREAGSAVDFDRRVLFEEPGSWSLAAIILRPGQQIHPHDHGGWGCAATVQGTERDRRFVHDTNGSLVQSSEHDYPPGTGYLFTTEDVHQPVGADPRKVTVALHFLVHTQPPHSH